MNPERTGTRDLAYDLMSVAYHALQGAQTYDEYAQDAQQAGDMEMAQYFRGLINEERQRADKAKSLLKKKLG